MSEQRHYLTPDLVLKEAWDPEHEALKTIPAANTEFSVALSAEEGDSVIAKKQGMSIKESDGAVSCVGMEKACRYGNGSVEVSPTDDGNDFVSLSTSELVVVDICARRIRIAGAGILVIHG